MKKFKVIAIILLLIGTGLLAYGFIQKSTAETKYAEWEKLNKEIDSYSGHNESLSNEDIVKLDDLDRQRMSALLEFSDANEYWKGMLIGGGVALVLGIGLFVYVVRKS